MWRRSGARSSLSPRTGSTAFLKQIIETFWVLFVPVPQILEHIVKVVALSELQVVERIQEPRQIVLKTVEILALA